MASISQQTEIPLLIRSPEAEMICFLFYFFFVGKICFFLVCLIVVCSQTVIQRNP